ncbi:hypothetical protein Arub01_35070 [Actinomadura rubrobrunea]|uniref:Uncharacterized protein n=1 Tax=Actinomadura rubrobrunea TaxID=115335 RepID=A0A9W6PYE6_9ACTN|nr:hypothetical protein [Actinomadura rubrobrunea]GLW65263.1 hypothetical protein Arub01_35070 [Actinomadura rubrobrunea]
MSAAVLAVALGAGACGGDSKDEANGSTSVSPSAASSSSAPATPPAGGNASSNGGTGSGTGSGGAGQGTAQNETQAKMMKVAQCMRDKGYDVQDPTPSGHIVFKNVKDAEAANKALNECRAKHNVTGP